MRAPRQATAARLNTGSLAAPPNPQDTTAPAAPGLPAVIGVTRQGAATLTVAAVSDDVAVTGYGAFVDGADTPAAESETPTINVTGLQPGAHRVAVKARDAAGNWSQAGASAAILVPFGGASARVPSSPLTLMELGLSLSDQGRSPSYSTNETNLDPATGVRTVTAVNPWSYVSRLTGAIRIYESAGKSGDTILPTETQPGILARVRQVVDARHRPDVCALWIGGNDINGMTSEEAATSGLEDMKWGFAQTVAALQNAGIQPWVMGMPFNAAWQLVPYRLRAYDLWQVFLKAFCRDNNLLYLGAPDQVIARPERQVPGTGKSVTRAGNVSTVAWTGHGFSTGDYVALTNSSNPALDVPAFTALTVVDANTVTLPSPGADLSGTTTVTRAGVYPDLVSDGTTHLSAKGAGRIGRLMAKQLVALLPKVDTLANCNHDYANLVGVGSAAAGDQISLSAMYGSGGTLSGTGTHTGPVPTGWTANINAGNPTVTHSGAARTDDGMSHRSWWQVAIAAGASDAQLELYVNHATPAAWSAGSKAAGAWCVPTAPNGYWYYTAAGGSQTGAEPAWPVTPGTTVTSGGVTWECRQAFKAGDILSAEGEVKVESVTDDTAVECLSFGLYDETNSANSILEHSFANTDNPPGYQAGDVLTCRTVEADAKAATTALKFGWKVRVKSGKSATLKFDRATMRNLTLAAALAAGTANAADTGPHGIYLLSDNSGTYHLDSLASLDKPFVDGFAWRAGWKELDTGATSANYDFAAVDAAIAGVQAVGKKISLLVSTLEAPAWVLNGASETWQAPGMILGSTLTAVVPWDSGALQAYSNFLDALANHPVMNSETGQMVALKDHPSLGGQITAHLPGLNGVRDTSNRLVAHPGFSDTGFNAAMIQAIQTTQAAFPKATSYLSFWGLKGYETSELNALIAEFDGVKSPKIGMFNEALKGDSPSGKVKTSFQSFQQQTGGPVLLQAVGSWTTHSPGNWTSGDNSPENGFSYGFSTFGCRYYEIYRADIDNPAFESVFLDWQAQLN